MKNDETANGIMITSPKDFLKEKTLPPQTRFYAQIASGIKHMLSRSSTNRHIWIAFKVPVVVDPDSKEYPSQQPGEVATRYVKNVLAKFFLVLRPPQQIQQPREGKLIGLHGLPNYHNVIPYEV